MKLAQRAVHLKPSPTLALAARAKSMVAEGRPVISLSVGEPDWPTFPEAVEAGVAAIHEGQTKYAPAAGMLGLRKAILHGEAPSLGVSYNLEEVTVSAGAKFILFSAFQCIIDVGDEVLIPSPYWVSYPEMVQLAGGLPKIVKTSAERQFKLTASDLRESIGPKTKLLLLNSPSNPTGSLYTRKELEDLAQVLLARPEVMIISDDIYNRLIFSGDEIAPHLLHVAPELKSRVVVVNGVSKTYSMTGWRVGWALGPQNLIAAMSNYQSQSVSCAAPFAQVAAERVLLSGSTSLAKALQSLKARRDFAVKELSQLKGLELTPPEGAFYLWTGINSLLGKTYQGHQINNSKEFAELLLEHAEVAVVPGQEFGQDGFVRMSYALSRESMGEAFRRIKTFVESLSDS